MALPTYTTTNIVDGGVANIVDLNTPFNEILILLTGALDALNIRDGGVETINIEDLGVLNANLAAAQVTFRAFADAAVEHGKLNFFSATQLVGAGLSVVINHNLGTLLPLVGVGLQAGAAVTGGNPYSWRVLDLNNITLFNHDTVGLTFQVAVL